MHWFRSIQRLGAGLGLFALLLQLSLSFGHIHPDDLLPRSLAGVADHVAGKAQPAKDPDGQSPASHDDCPICAVMHVAGTIVLPGAPTLSLPTQFTPTYFAARDFAYVSIARRLPFQIRAPPAA